MEKKPIKSFSTSRGKSSCENLQTGKFLVLDVLTPPVKPMCGSTKREQIEYS
jgi:hypothetical protein